MGWNASRKSIIKVSRDKNQEDNQVNIEYIRESYQKVSENSSWSSSKSNKTINCSFVDSKISETNNIKENSYRLNLSNNRVPSQKCWSYNPNTEELKKFNNQYIG